MTRPRKIDRIEAFRIGVTFLKCGSQDATAKIHRRSVSATHSVLVGLRLVKPRHFPRLADEEVLAMHAKYEAGASLSAVGRLYDRDRRSVAELFTRRGLKVRPMKYQPARDPMTGRLLPAQRWTAQRITALIATMKALVVPPVFRHHWREMTLDQRAAFVRRVRVKLASPFDMPQTSLSPGLEAFEYGSKRAHEIADRENFGLNSKYWKIHLKITSQGVIFRDQLWFWCHKVGYMRGPWTEESGRPSLHHVLWEERNGEIPPGCVIRFADGNRNNFAPKNLKLLTRNDVARENQAAALLRKSRERTALLLTRNHRKEDTHGLIHDLRKRHSRSEASALAA